MSDSVLIRCSRIKAYGVHCGLGLPEAFTYVYRIYEPQVIRWVYNHSQFEQTAEHADYFAGSAMSNFYFAVRGLKSPS